MTVISIAERRVAEYSNLSDEVIQQNERVMLLPGFSLFQEEQPVSNDNLAEKARVVVFCIEEGVDLLNKIERIDEDYRTLLDRGLAKLDPEFIDRINKLREVCYSRAQKLLEVVSCFEYAGIPVARADELRNRVEHGIMPGLEQSRINSAAAQAATGRGRPFAEVMNEIRSRHF